MVEMRIPDELLQRDLEAYYAAERKIRQNLASEDIARFARELRLFLEGVEAKSYSAQQMAVLMPAFNRRMGRGLSQVEENTIYAQAAAKAGWVLNCDAGEIPGLHPWEINQIVEAASAAIEKALTIPGG